MPSTLEIARAYVLSGLSVIPIKADGSKGPACPWKLFQQRKPTEAELIAWFVNPGYGIAIICGAVSGSLEVLDFDDMTAFVRWEAAMREDCPEIWAALPVVATPGNGRHVFYRLPCCPAGNRKLARGYNKKATVETRGEGGYVLAPGCPPACHPSGQTYRHVAGPPLTQIPTIETDNVKHL